jgi:hypothetical protein
MANEKRLINVTPLIDECDECMRIEWNKSVYTTWAEAEEDFKNRLMDAPTVDAVEVVRCKDCEYYEIGKDYLPYCNHCDGGIADYPRKDDFCSRGERKDNGKTD